MRAWYGGIFLLAGLVAPAGLAMAQQDSATARPQPKGGYTIDQATRGATVFREQCSACHLPRDHAGDDFKQEWNGRAVKVLFDYLRSTMPDDGPGELTDQQYLDVVAYILKLNGMPAGDIELTADTTGLKNLIIDIKPSVPSFQR